MSKQYPMTKAGKKKLEQELAYLKDVRRTQLAEDINEARRFCDFSEDVTFREMINERTALEEQIKTLENMISHATFISEKQTTSTITLGSTVTFIEIPNGEPETYSIVGTIDANPSHNKISSESPIAQSLLGNKENDQVSVETPGGTIQVKIIHVQ